MRPEHWSEQPALTDGGGSPPDLPFSMDPDSPDGSSALSNGGKARQRLKPWLETQINSGRFPGVEWVDKAKGLFRISWKHGGRADWSEQDGLIFKEWAIHTGRYREGTDNPDWPSWKTRLRCALNKLPDIQEQKDLSCYDEPHPYRVYKFVDKRATGSGSISPTQQQQYHHHHHHQHEQQPGLQSMMCDDDSCGYGGPSELYQPTHRPSVIQPNLPNIIPETLDSDGATHNQEACGGESQVVMGSLRSLENINDLLPKVDVSLTNISIDSNINSCPEPMETDSLRGASCHQIKPEPTELPDTPYYQTAIDDHRLTLEIRYRRQVIKSLSLSELRGCRVFYGNPPHFSSWSQEKYDARDVQQICVPYSHGQMEERQDSLTKKLLNALELGIDIYVDKGDIYIFRRCKASVYVAPANKMLRETIKVERDQPAIKIFDFSNNFLGAFMRYQQGEGPPPSPCVVIAIGQNYHTDHEPYTNLLLSVTVYHPQASHLMSHMPQSQAVAISRPENHARYTDYATANNAAMSAAQPLPLYSTNATN